ncbi:hypothetical protein [Synechococcus sp. J7-Johnson]|uniref:hypothetical protein n=1 Tax=Synechococcus sp. J7-Johnson TaxID=2823737 RepID=UPI0020CEAD6F|nr:hypothetical protein [Synechococcus sp. J7-Johnson]
MTTRTDPSLRSELRPFSWNQAQVTEASHLVVFLVRRQIEESDLDRLIAATADLRGQTPEQLAGYRSADDKHASLAKVRYPLAELIKHR